MQICNILLNFNTHDFRRLTYTDKIFEDYHTLIKFSKITIH